MRPLFLGVAFSLELNKKVVIVTGASSGIGEELSYQLASQGAHVVVSARNKPALERVAKKITDRRGSALAVKADVTQKNSVIRLIQRTVKQFRRIDILVSNAGITHEKKTLMECGEADVRSILETNLMGGIYGVWAAVPEMEKQGGGLLVFVSSIVGKRGVPYSAVYCASKFAVQGLTESIRLELKPKNIRVLTVCPPGVDTPFYENNRRGEKRTNRLHPVRVIAQQIVRACEQEKREVLLTIDSKILHRLNYYCPRLLDVAIAKMKGL